jgi:Spy/CpxP family protein refolding chaperone
MNRNKIVIASLLTACLMTTSAFAAANKSAVSKTTKPSKPSTNMKAPAGNKMVDPMAALVKAGTITQTQADAIKSAMDAARNSKTDMSTVISSLVTAGTTTQAQADAITKSMPKPPADGQGQPGDHQGKDPMSALVTAGTITQTQADAIKSAMDVARNSKTDMSTVISSLVTAGTITQAQADAITKSMPKPPADGQGQPGDHQGTDPMSALVTAGTITQTQADTIKNAMDAARDSNTDMSTVISNLVTAGTITQTQADAITSSMPQHK